MVLTYNLGILKEKSHSPKPASLYGDGRATVHEEWHTDATPFDSLNPKVMPLMSIEDRIVSLQGHLMDDCLYVYPEGARGPSL